MNENHPAWDIDEAVAYYRTTRNKPGDLYESERVFFLPVVPDCASVLDLGCAAGGTYNIIREVNPQAAYTGLDVSPAMIDAARRLFPEADFRRTAGDVLEFPDNAFELVLALGVFNHIPDWKSLLRECCRVASRYCLLDLTRLLPQAHVYDAAQSYMVLADRFSSAGEAAAETRVPYVLTDAAEMFAFILDELRPKRVLAKGYFGPYSPSITAPFPEVCFTVALIEKGDGQGPTDLVVDLPRPIRERLTQAGIAFDEPFARII
ncbi:class I SAM-dependent methyltransferase [Solidesulfovibrio sp.]